MPDDQPRSPYPTKKQLLLLARDVLDQKPPAIKLIKDLVNHFQVPTLEAANNLARAYLDTLAQGDEDPK